MNPLNIVKNILLQHSQNPTHFTNFPANMAVVVPRNEHLHYAISRRPKTAFSKH